MVNGLDTFKKAFRGYEDCYTIIGGTACDILMSEQNYSFRATKDIDMIIIIDVRLEEFASVLWDFINSGGYKSGWRGTESPHYYRFTDPKSPEYPKMIELFSRNPGYDLKLEDSVTTPIHVSDDISSLSAIMLNDDYYNLMLEGRRVVDGVGVLSAEYIIPFKMRAYRDLNARKDRGEAVNTEDLKKHKNDTFRLINIIPADMRVKIPDTVKDDVKWFIDNVNDGRLVPANLGVELEIDEALEFFRRMYL